MKKLLLTVLDGFGMDHPHSYNAITQTPTPHWDWLCQKGVLTTLQAHGAAVGLPENQMGNSEVGHLTLGAGRVIPQSLVRIDEALSSAQYRRDPLWRHWITSLQQQSQPLHCIGLVSEGGVHSHIRHLYQMIDHLLAEGISDIRVHAILDGRDTLPQSGLNSIERLNAFLTMRQLPEVASIIGRYYAMDRDQRFERIQKALDLYLHGKAEITTSWSDTLSEAYAQSLSDEFITPYAKPHMDTISTNTPVLLWNFRADRMRQLTQGLLNAHIAVTSFTQYDETLNTSPLFPPMQIQHTLGEIVSRQGYRQLRLAETEKYPHVTYFFNAGSEMPFEGEERLLIPSPKVATYDLQPQMSAPEITKTLCESLSSPNYQFILVNFANADMVGHTGDWNATCEAIICLDDCLGEIQLLVEKHQWQWLITSDHGNADCLFDETHQLPLTAHTCAPVPFLLWNREGTLHSGSLADVAPTILTLMGLPIPNDMSGKNLWQPVSS